MSVTAGIIGAGKLGTALASEFDKLNLLKFVISDNLIRNQIISSKLSENVIISNWEDFSEDFPDILFLTVQDSKIEQLAEYLKANYSEKLSDTIVVHCSGFMPKNILSSLYRVAKSTAKLHPYQTFFNADENVFKDTAWTAECDDFIKPEITKLVEILNGKVVFIDEIQNFNSEKYHISAVFSSNYLAANLRYAYKIAKQSGINPNEFIPKISKTSLDNSLKSFNSDSSESFAITGPIARGDILAVQNHIESLRENLTELKGYVLFGLATAEIAYTDKIITKETYTKLKNIFLCEINNLF